MRNALQRARAFVKGMFVFTLGFTIIFGLIAAATFPVLWLTEKYGALGALIGLGLVASAVCALTYAFSDEALS